MKIRAFAACLHSPLYSSWSNIFKKMNWFIFFDRKTGASSHTTITLNSRYVGALPRTLPRGCVIALNNFFLNTVLYRCSVCFKNRIDSAGAVKQATLEPSAGTQVSPVGCAPEGSALGVWPHWTIQNPKPKNGWPISACYLLYRPQQRRSLYCCPICQKNRL